MSESELHPLIAAAARGGLPGWAAVKDSRLGHLESVATLLARWAEELGLDERDRLRWAAAGWLHDALRDADPNELADAAADFPEAVRHGPAAAIRLESAGIDDEELVDAVRYHTLGRNGLGRLGRFLFLADYLEPGRDFGGGGATKLRARLPEDLEPVLKTVCAWRIGYLIGCGIPIRPETAGFWKELSGT